MCVPAQILTMGVIIVIACGPGVIITDSPTVHISGPQCMYLIHALHHNTLGCSSLYTHCKRSQETAWSQAITISIHILLVLKRIGTGLAHAGIKGSWPGQHGKRKTEKLADRYTRLFLQEACIWATIPGTAIHLHHEVLDKPVYMSGILLF